MGAGSLYLSDMCRSRIEDIFITCLQGFRPERHSTTRSLGFYSAAITLSDTDCLRDAARICVSHGVTSEQIYETMLQSYLFLGFPRMLSAAECLKAENLAPVRTPHVLAQPGTEVEEWRERGEQLCRTVYQGNYEALKARVEAMAPEVFLWMELEGYGKVLSRPGLHIIDREIAVVACLMIENRPVQLHSHLRGALNVGASGQLLRDVVTDLAPLSPQGYTGACEILERLGVA